MKKTVMMVMMLVAVVRMMMKRVTECTETHPLLTSFMSI